MESEIIQIKWDITGVSEVGREESSKTLKTGHLYYSKDSETQLVGGIGNGFAHKEHVNNIIYTKNMSTRVAY